jgi:hypothetical protein
LWAIARIDTCSCILSKSGINKLTDETYKIYLKERIEIMSAVNLFLRIIRIGLKELPQNAGRIYG